MQLSLPNLKAAIAVSLKRLKKVVDSLFYLQLQSKYASHGHMYEVFYSFVLVFESKTHTRTALHVSIAKKKNARPGVYCQ